MLVTKQHVHNEDSHSAVVEDDTDVADEKRPKQFGKWKIAIFISFFVVAALALFVLGRERLQQALEWLASLNPVAVFGAIALLPVFGFSVSIVYVLAGIKFGPVWGTVVVAAAIAIHLLGSHYLAKSFLKDFVLRLLKRRNHKIPEIPLGENGAASLMIALIPGLPYALRNYLLPLAGIPLKDYFWICLPVYLLRSFIAIFFGDLSLHMSGGKLAFIIFFVAIKLAICAYLIQRLRKRFKNQKSEFAKA